eukprot:TRINITY_DN96125_c0_g1_i2.p1 TRINITY_DN96125_c0_g1~~TRINITY_DN96125_c0_g1_i2.p1  ORF type:complete len:279 (-),score=4.05 TRINITY_DN96125_c0_g1_i2:33-869(-)
MQDWCDKLPDPDATSLITREVKKIVDAAGTKGIAIKPGDVAYMRIYELTRHCESNNMGYGPLNGEHQWSADVVADDLSTDFIPAPKFLHIVAYLHKKYILSLRLHLKKEHIRQVNLDWAQAQAELNQYNDYSVRRVQCSGVCIQRRFSVSVHKIHCIAKPGRKPPVADARHISILFRIGTNWQFFSDTEGVTVSEDRKSVRKWRGYCVHSTKVFWWWKLLIFGHRRSPHKLGIGIADGLLNHLGLIASISGCSPTAPADVKKKVNIASMKGTLSHCGL